ncbi:MAG: DUF881 domain-containing protein [Mobilicoccus sp.]|nr:DUF881 domain-containing protein [Mobilicoccus sp.]
MSTDTPHEEAPQRSSLLALRPTRSTILAGLLTLGLGVALSMQITTTRDRGLEMLGESELISILDTVTSESDRLGEEVRSLELQRERLAAGEEGGAEALERARRRTDDLAVLVGTVPAEGPGVRLSLGRGADGALSAGTLLDLTQELRDAGAEAIQIADVRVVASTAFVDDGDDVVVGGSTLTWPVRVVAIGDDRTLASALAIPGGVEESVRQLGGTISVEQSTRVLVNALHAPSEPRYARAVTSPEADTP